MSAWLVISLSTQALVLPHAGLDRADRRSLLLGAAVAATVPCWSALPAVAASVPRAWTLANGVTMPTLALNTAGLSADDSERATREAFAAGIKHVDFHPGIERDGVARALKSVDRSALFLTTKISKPPPGTTKEAARKLVSSQLDKDLAVLGVDHVDMLMLRDSLDPEVMQAQWAGMEEALGSGRARSVGVINYCEGSLRAILETAKTPPALNCKPGPASRQPPPALLRTTSAVRLRPAPMPSSPPGYLQAVFCLLKKPLTAHGV